MATSGFIRLLDGQDTAVAIAAADLSAALASPPAIGGTTPSTGKFTTATLTTLQAANGDLNFKGQGNGQFVFGPSGWAYTTAASGAGSIFLSNGTNDSPNVKWAYGNNVNFSLDVFNAPTIYGCQGYFLRFVKDADESTGAVIAGLDGNGNFSAKLGIYGNGGIFAGTLYGLSADGTLACAAMVQGISKQAANYAVSLSDRTVLADASSGAYTVSLPSSPATGRVIAVKKTDSSANAVTVSGNGRTIDGRSQQSPVFPICIRAAPVRWQRLVDRRLDGNTPSS